MAKRKARNLKTHPRVAGENDANDGFMPPDRPDVISRSEAATDPAAEVVDVLGTDRAGVVKVRDSEGDEDGLETTQGSHVERRGETAEPAPARRAEREDRAVRQRAAPQDEEGGEDDDRAYSRRVQKRIARERAIVNRERTLREQAQRELGEERTARQELSERVLRIEREGKVVAANTDVKALESQIEALVPQIAAATEAGDTAKALSLQIKLGDLQGDLKVLKFELKLRGENARIVEENERRERERREAAAKRGAPAAEDGLTDEERRAAAKFPRVNRRWWNSDADAKEAALAIDAEILEELDAGDLDFDKYSDEHFEELAQRLHEEFPELEIRDLDREPYQFDDQAQDLEDRGGARGARRGARVSNNQRQNGNRAPQGRLGSERRVANEVEMARQGRVVLTEDDFKEMRVFKMDPNNPEHKKAFAKERARTILAGAARGDDQRGAR